KIESSQCAFRFFVTNPKGSTHRFDIENVQFDALSEKSVSEIPSIKSEKFKLASAELLETKSSTAHSLNLV
ncbi:MAG: hypothetical protein V4692_11165, partial [Bdellovibrionota bacterium]